MAVTDRQIYVMTLLAALLSAGALFCPAPAPARARIPMVTLYFPGTCHAGEEMNAELLGDDGSVYRAPIALQQGDCLEVQQPLAVRYRAVCVTPTGLTASSAVATPWQGVPESAPTCDGPTYDQYGQPAGL